MTASSYTRTVALEQNGCSTVPPNWTEFPPGSAVTYQPAGLAGLVYSLPIRTATQFNPPRALDPPIWVRAGPLVLTATGTLGGSYNLYFVPNPRPALFSVSNLPVTVGATLVSSGVLSPFTGTITVNLTTAQNTTIRQVTSNPAWNGRLAFVLEWQLIGPDSFTASALTNTTLQAFWSGLTGGPAGPRRRFVRDHRYGMPALNSELVRDGDQPGLFVRPWDADPLDEPNTYRPRPGEGTVDDGIGDL